jgi:endogenous inhibitor of DNA gyrase (YacG/DUF329 family)
MAVARRQRVIHAECPTCHWIKAVLAHEDPRKRCFLCPHCQHVWDTTETARDEHARLQHRTKELREEHEMLKEAVTKPGPAPVGR